MSAFPQAFVSSVRAVFGERASQVLEALESGESVTAVRANPAKISSEQLRSRFGASSPVPWRTDAFYLETRPVFSLDPLLHAGAYYVQDPAAMFVGTVADAVIAAENRPLKVLDLCAAPGGKSTCLAAALKPSDLLVANEVIGSRAGILAENLVKWGSVNTVVTNNDPKDFARLAATSDLILADVPCSGEGMFRKDAGAVAEWSPENVNLCAARQRRIIADAWDSLCEGGWLIYSTCTFNSSENDDNVEWICRELGAEVVPPSAASNSFCHRVEKIPGLQKNSTLNAEGGTDGCPVATKYGLQFAPGITRGEGQYVALMRKTSTSKASPRSKNSKPAKSVACDWVGSEMTCREVATSAGQIIKAYPSNIENDIREIETALRAIRSGVAVATIKGRDRIPTTDLALSQAFNRNAFPQVELTKEQALKFLRCEALQLPDASKGFLTVTYEQLPIGFVKNLGSRANNLFPQAWRLKI